MAPSASVPGWYVSFCPVNGSDRRNWGYGWRVRKGATSGRAAPTRDAAPPAAKSGRSATLSRRCSTSTVGNLLERHNLTKPRRKVRRTPAWGQPFSGAHLPNQLWCADFKGHFRTCDGQRVDPLTVADANSRYLLACQSVQRTGSQEVRRVLERVFREYGLPQAIRTDNGPPFASVGLGGLTQLLVWWTKLGVIPERIEPGHPEQNGRLERLHRTLKAETAKPPRHTRRNQQQAL